MVLNTPPDPSSVAPVLIYTALVARDVSGKVSRDKTNQKYH